MPSAFRNDIPFVKELGVEFISADNGRAVLALNLAPRHLNSWSVAHGGVLMTLLDVAMAVAGRSLDPDAGAGVTLEMKTSFLQPANAGTRLILHHYPTSPFAEKIRLIMGAKAMHWSSVLIPLIMPKPDVVALTGGYRKTPILSLVRVAGSAGADPGTLPRTWGVARTDARIRTRHSRSTRQRCRDRHRGELYAATRARISIARTDPRAGRVVVHFPRLGFELRRLL